MKALDAIRIALKFSDMGMKHLGEMNDAPLLRPGPWGGNHAMWIAGHLAVVEGRLQQMLHGTANPVAQWKPLFDWGTEPISDVTAYPPFDEVLRAYRELRAKNLGLLEEIGEAGLDRPTKSPPPGLEEVFRTIGQTFLTIALHQTFHGGQASVARRASGRRPFFVPSEELRKS